MRLLEFIEYSVSPATKFTICAAIGFAIYIVYYWEPNKNKKKKETKKENTGFLQYTEVDPRDYDQSDHLIKPVEQNHTITDRHPTLEQLDEYVDQLKRHNFQSIDRV